MNIISDYFDEGLATNLVHLQLTYQCNDSMLHAIGRHAVCLKTLDVSCSSNVTVSGIKKLLFKVRGNISGMPLNAGRPNVILLFRITRC